MLTHIILIVGLALAYTGLVRRRKYNTPKGFKLPPGPPGKPIVGHFFQLSEIFRSERMREWKEKYGNIVYIHTFGVPIIFLYSDEIARELLDKRGATYSDRPPFYAADILGWDCIFALYRYGDWWRRHIKATQQYFNPRAASKFEPVQMKSCRLLLHDLLETPTNFSDHIMFVIGRIMMETLYAIEIKRKNDQIVNTVHYALEGASQVLLPGERLIDIFPILKHVPRWVPGITINKLYKKYRQSARDACDIPFNSVKSRNREKLGYSLVSNALEKLRTSGDSPSDSETIIKNTATTIYAAGMGTTFSAVLQAIVALLLYPKAQKNVQEELDRVLGDRLPTLADRTNLPYVNAFCHEVLRWRPSIPLGVPHAALEDGTYGEYFIPKGSIIFADSWQILRSSKYGSNPEDFNPERFLQPGVFPPTEQYGFGGRMCPGRYFADNTLFLLIASILKVFDITPMKDEHGIDVLVTDEITASPLPFPVPFQCSITPRSHLAKDIILTQELGQLSN